MNCPVCKRELAPTLSICLTCGAMMNDTVREELETKIGRLPPSLSGHEPILESPAMIETHVPLEPRPMPIISAPAPPRPKAVTSELNKKNTSPTLVDFQHKNPTLPDWRIELQNSIRKRNGNGATATVEPATLVATQPASVAAPASVAVPTSAPILKNEKVANALRRIEESRKTFGGIGTATARVQAPAPRKPAVPNRSFPFNVVERTPTAPNQPIQTAPAIETPKPKLVTPFRIEKKKFDTNKLPPIPAPEIPLLVEPAIERDLLDAGQNSLKTFERVSIRNTVETIEAAESEIEEIGEVDGLAPFSMRFGAAVFDLIIGGFAAVILMSPFLVSNSDLATISGFLAFGGAILLLMFIYRTATIAFLGRTFGMRLFSIEIIDTEDNDLPSLHQAAVSSAVYLLSLLTLGIAFLPALYNEEQRTLHDMLSGTVMVREEEV